MTTYFSFPIHKLSHVVGENRADGTRVLQGRQGNASFGPYERLTPGRYFGGFYIRAIERPKTDGALTIDACCDEGREKLGECVLGGSAFNTDIASLHGLHFTITHEAPDVEIRLYFSGAGVFEVGDMVLFRTDLR